LWPRPQRPGAASAVQRIPSIRDGSDRIEACQQARAAGIAQSMGSRGACFDNAVAERSWPEKAELRTEVFDYIEVSSTTAAGTAASAISPRRSSRRSSPPTSSKSYNPSKPPCPPNRGKSTSGVRWVEDVRGTWLYHCHVESHMRQGMIRIYQVR
jgi:hypothetical protein